MAGLGQTAKLRVLACCDFALWMLRRNLLFDLRYAHGDCVSVDAIWVVVLFVVLFPFYTHASTREIGLNFHARKCIWLLQKIAVAGGTVIKAHLPWKAFRAKLFIIF
jgi:hypothetical protein